MIIKATLLCIMYILLQYLTWTSAELFSDISEMESLLETQKKIVDELDDYISKKERALEILRKHQNRYKKEQMMAMEDIPNYIGNPVNAFTLIKRLTTDLDFIENIIEIGTDNVWNITMKHANVKYPNLEDLTGAVQALTRLQETYNLDIGELAEGKLNGVAYSTPMTADDCYELGRTLYNKRDYVNSLRWMTEALRKFKEQDDLYNSSEVDIIEKIGSSHFLLGDVEQALEWTNKLLALDPKHLRARDDIIDFEKIIQEKQAKLQKQSIGKTGEGGVVEEKPFSSSAKQENLYASLCRGEVEISSEMKKKLQCSYLTENHPFLKLAPIKMEQVYIGPDIFLFHQVISDDEIEHVKEMAKPRFQRALVVDFETGKNVATDYRISKLVWLRNEESEVVARISRRVADFTGLSMDSAEDLQVVNYGIGGHYGPHFDFKVKNGPALSTAKDNRIATVLFYMSEVAQGGATVFTELGLSVFPVKNAAVFWMNLHPSGEGDIASRHAACPVLRGSKWGESSEAFYHTSPSNKWIHQIGQELLKPCTLEHQREEDMREIPRFHVPLSSR